MFPWMRIWPDHSLRFFASVLVALAFPNFGCQPTSNTSSQRAANKTVIIGVDSAPESLDPRVGTSMASYRAHYLIFNSLTNQDAGGHLVPELAESWREEKISTDSGESWRWVFTLRENVFFHNGKPFSSEDVVYTFKSLLDPDFISRKKPAFEYVADVIATSPREVVFIMKRAYPNFVAGVIPAVGIVAAGLTTDPSEKPVGTGPFRYAGRVGQQRFFFSANEAYFMGKPGINKIELKVIPDDTTRALELMHGSVDLVINDLGVTDAFHLGSLSKMRMQQSGGLPYVYIGINHTHPALGNRLVRQAIAYAIDRKKIIADYYRGLARLAVSPLIPELWKERKEFFSYPYDPDKAMELLDLAGFRDPDGDGPKPRLSVEMKCTSYRETRDLAIILRQQLAKVGIEVHIKALEFQTYYSDIVQGNFSLFIFRWIGINNPDFFGAVFHSTSVPGGPDTEVPKRGVVNRGRYANPLVDALIEEAEIETDTNKRWRIYSRLHDVLSDDLPYIDLWYRNNFAVMRADLEGLQLTLNGSFAPLYKLKYKE